MQSSERFWDKVAVKYAKRPIRNMAAYEETLDRVRALLRPTDTVLELGCGTGTTAIRLAPAAGNLTGTDVSGAMVKIARARAAEEGILNLSFEQADALAADQADESFDAVLAFNLLHLLDDLPGVLARTRALLRPGGLFISKTPCLSEMSVLWRPLITVMQVFGIAPPLAYLGTGDLERELTAAGFEVTESGTFSKAPASRFIVARRAAAA